MALDPNWITEVRDALRPGVGALAFVIVNKTLDAIGVSAEEMSVRKIPAFLGKLKEHLPEGVDREEISAEVGRILLAHVVRAANDQREDGNDQA